MAEDASTRSHATPSGPRSLFLSPHYDDVTLSCGGTVALAGRAGDALVVTVFGGAPTGELNEFATFQHQRWGTEDDTVGQRRAEDARAMAELGARYKWLDFPDAIYRGELYLSDDELFGEVKAADDVAPAIATVLNDLIDDYQPDALYVPLAAGGHVDHRICLAVIREIIQPTSHIFFFEDFPYAASAGIVELAVAALDPPAQPILIEISATIDRRLAAIAAYESQLATIFRHYGAYAEVVRAYSHQLDPSNNRYYERFWQVGTTDEAIPEAR